MEVVIKCDIISIWITIQDSDFHSSFNLNRDIHAAKTKLIFSGLSDKTIIYLVNPVKKNYTLNLISIISFGWTI